MISNKSLTRTTWIFNLMIIFSLLTYQFSLIKSKNQKTQTIRKIYGILNAGGDVTPLIPYFDPSVQRKDKPSLVYLRSKSGNSKGPLSILFPEWANFNFVMESIIVQGKLVITYGDLKGTYSSSNQIVSGRVTHIWEFNKDKIIRLEQIFEKD